MKKIILMICIFIFSLTSCSKENIKDSEEVNKNDLLVKNGELIEVLNKDIKKIEINNEITKINKDAFDGCFDLESLIISKTVKDIECGNPVYGGLDEIIVDSENSYYDSRDNCNAIIETSTNKLIVGSNNTKIPDTVSIIGDEAFYTCKDLKNIYIPSSVVKIEDNPFLFCEGLESIDIDSENKNFDSRENCNCLIDSESNNLIIGCSNSKIPEGVETIESFAFNEVSMKELYIPASLKNFNLFAFSGTFDNIIVNEDNLKYDSRNNCNAIIETKTNLLVRGCYNTKIPDDVIELGKGAFRGDLKIISFIIPEQIKKINYNCLECENLKEVKIYSKEINIEGLAFSRSLEKMFIKYDAKISFGSGGVPGGNIEIEYF